MIDEDAIDRLKNHNFTGNLIELRNIASRVLSQNKDQVITRADIDRALRGTEYYDISHDQERVGLIGSLSEDLAASLPSPESTQAVLANKTSGSTDQSDEVFANLNTVAKIKDMPATDEDASTDNTSKPSSASSEKASSHDTSDKAQESDHVLNLRDQEIRYFKDLLERFQGDKQKVADASGLNLRTLYRRLKNLDIDWP
jgi:DNA-binding NtrC family response regulator